jgi:hypothetical protein
MAAANIGELKIWKISPFKDNSFQEYSIKLNNNNIVFYYYLKSFSYLYKMDFTSISFIIGLSVGFIKYSEYIHRMYISNTNLIIKQNDQISFLLKRLVDLNKKIVKLEFEFTALSETNACFADDELVVKEELVKEDIVENLQANVIENNFEIIETAIDDKLNKKKGWFRPFF